MNKFILIILGGLGFLAAQDGTLLIPNQIHQYSGISPLDVTNIKLHSFDLMGNAQITRVTSKNQIAASAPYPEFHWDSNDNDLGYIIGGNGPFIQTWRPSTKNFTTLIDYTGRFASITTGGTTDITYDNWEAFWAPTEHTLCAVDLTAKKTYCLDVNLPDPVNHLPNTTPNVDFVLVTPRDSVSKLHYVLMMASPAMGVFIVDEVNNTLKWFVRPETVVPMMGSGKGNNDGNCDPNENCITTPHGDILTAPDGQVYFETITYIEHQATSKYFCEGGQGLMRINSGLKMTTPENYADITGGGLKYAGPDYNCGGQDVWSGQHTGCARFGQYCVVSFDTGKPTTQTNIPRKNELWLIGLDTNNAIIYKKVGVSSSSFVNANTDPGMNYWSSSRASLSMDGTQIIYDSDAGTNGITHNIYELPTGLTAIKPPSKPTPPQTTDFTQQEIQILKSLVQWILGQK